jgi:glucose-6-phosphate dehydrogenase assembly protein OpcA
MSNLVIFCDGSAGSERADAEVAAIVALHPARVLLLVAEPSPGAGEITAAVRVRGHVVDPGRWVCSEEVTLTATGRASDRLPSVVRTLLIGDLPTTLWWTPTRPPPLAAELLHELVENVEQVIYDSVGWREPARDVVATAGWLSQMEGETDQGRWRVVSDLNWRRLKYWRRLLTQALDPASAPGVLGSVREVLLEHGPHAVVQAWELVSWLAARLGWKVQDGRMQPGVELGWHFAAAHGPVQVRIRRLEQGPPELRRVRITALPGGKTAVLNMAAAEEERRLAAVPEEEGAVPRTVTVPPLTLAQMVAQQMSDRRKDPIFIDSMALAGQLARSVLGS